MATAPTPTADASVDVAAAIARVEEELIASMVRNLARHVAGEGGRGMSWPQWQAEQLAQLDAWARAAGLRAGPAFARVNALAEAAIRQAHATAGAEEEERILRAMGSRRDASRRRGNVATLSPSGVHAPRLEALVRAVTDDLDRAEHAVLRRARDRYRQVVFDAQAYAASGAGTYAQAVDMATRDLLDGGIDCVVYKNGSRHTAREYAQMAVRTATRRAALMAEGERREEWGVHAVVVNYRGADACPRCMRWCGQVLVDDVYGGGTVREAQESGRPLLSEAMAEGLLHPNCRDRLSTWFPGVSEEPRQPTREQEEEAGRREEAEAGRTRAESAARSWGRRARHSLDPANRSAARARASAWEARAEAVEVRLEGTEEGAGPEPVPQAGTGVEERADKKARRAKRGTRVDLEKTESEGYRGLFDRVAGPELADGLCGKAREFLRHRSGTVFEDFGLFEVKGGTVRDTITTVSKPHQVELTPKSIAVLRNAKGRSLVTMHNHPDSMPPSSSDFVTASFASVRFGLVVNHDGSLVKYEVSNRARFFNTIRDGMLGEIDKTFAEMSELYGTRAGDDIINDVIGRRFGIRYERHRADV